MSHDGADIRINNPVLSRIIYPVDGLRVPDKQSGMRDADNAKQKRERKPENVEAGKRLEHLRDALDFKTKVAFAAWLDVPEFTYRKWTTGENEIPTYIINKLKEEKGVTSDWLKHGDASGLPARLYQKLRE